MNFLFLIFLSFLIYFDCNSKNSNEICEPELLKNYENIEENLKVCDPGNRLFLKFSINLSPERLITKLCDLRFSVIFEREKAIVNLKDNHLSIVCIYLPIES